MRGTDKPVWNPSDNSPGVRWSGAQGAGQKPKRIAPHDQTLARQSCGDDAHPRDPQPGSCSVRQDHLTRFYGAPDARTLNPTCLITHHKKTKTFPSERASERDSKSLQKQPQQLDIFGYDLYRFGFDVHQKNYHAGPDSLKILYCTKNHRNLQRQLQSRLGCLQKGTMAKRKHGRKKPKQIVTILK